MKKQMYLIKRKRVLRKLDRLIFWKLRKARFAMPLLFCFGILTAQDAVSKGQEAVMDFKVERAGSEAAYTSFENRPESIQLQGLKELGLKEKSYSEQILEKNHIRVKVFLSEMGSFFESNGKRGESMNFYMNGLTQFYKMAELYRTMTLSERKMIKDFASGDKSVSPVVNYLDAFAALNQEAFLRVLAEMFAQDNPKLSGKTMKPQDIELMLQIVKLGSQDVNASNEHERSSCTDPHLSATST